MQRLFIPALALAFLVAPFAPLRLSASAPPRLVAPGGASCFVGDGTVASTAIVSPADGLVVSAIVPLAVVTPTDTIDTVAVCATYQSAAGILTGPTLVTLLGNGTGTWSGSWDVSSLPEQSGVTLLFIAHYPSGQEDLIGQRSVTINRTLVVDTTPPTSTLSFEGNVYTPVIGTTYIAGNTPIMLSATDSSPPNAGPSGVAAIYYQIDGGAVYTYTTTPFDLNAYADGPRTIAYWAVDNAGNTESPHNVTVFLDKTSPSITPHVAGTLAPGGIAYYPPVTVSFEATDAGSGPQLSVTYNLVSLQGDRYLLRGQQFTLNTSDVVDYQALDNVGNSTSGVLSIPIVPWPVATSSPTDVPTETATPTDVPTRTATPTHTPRPTATPSPAHTPTAAHTVTPTHTSTATHTPGPTPTWAPIDGPPILNRTPAKRQAKNATSHAAPPTPAPLHVHVLPPAAPTRHQAAHRRPREPSGGKGARTGGYILDRILPIPTSKGSYTACRGRRTWGWT